MYNKINRAQTQRLRSKLYSHGIDSLIVPKILYLKKSEKIFKEVNDWIEKYPHLIQT